MKVKIDTKEKLHVITIHEPNLAANMTEQMDKVLAGLLDESVKSVVLNLEDIRIVDSAAADELIKLQMLFNAHQASFVVCCLQPVVKKFLNDRHLLDHLNWTVSESEAIDIVQLEELEREIGS